MKTKRIITATLLSTGLILGTTNAAVAADPAPSANLTVASYSSQLATFNLAAAAFDQATVAFRTQISTQATALVEYKASNAALTAAYQAAAVANAPVSTATRYSNMMVAFNVASVAYHNASSVFASQSKVYSAAVQSYEMAYRNAMDTFKIAIAAYGQLKATIYMNFENSVKKANAVFAVSLRASKTKAQKSNAMNTRVRAMVAAIATRAAARVALGDAPIKPIQQIKLVQKVDAYVALRPVHPAMAV